MSQGPISRVRVSGPLEQVRRFLARHPMESQCVTLDTWVRLDLFVDTEQRELLLGFGLRIDKEFDASANLRARQEEVNHDRLAAAQLPDPVGRIVR